MRRFQAIAIAAAVIASAAPARAAANLPSVLQVLGTVTESARPVSNALVIALNLQDLAATQVWTATDGTFVLPALRTGIYKVIAVKNGFAPAIATILPTQPSHRIALRLEQEKSGRKSGNQEIWELRGSLPPDVLRELDFAMQPIELAAYDTPRFRGEMLSLTGMSTTPSNPAYAQTALGLEGRIGAGWKVGIRGNLQRFEDPTDDVSFGTPLAESAVMSMEVESAGAQSYRVASTKSSWAYRDPVDGERQADVRAHNFEWRNGPAQLQVRYFEQDHLFPDTPVQSNLIELAGSVPVLRTPRSDLGVSLRVTQESIARGGGALRTADVAANGTMSVLPSLIVHYGLASRLGVDGQEVAPRTGLEWKVTKATSLVGSVQYKVLDYDPETAALPSLVFWSDDARVLPQYTWTVGVVSGKDQANQFSAIATVSAADDALRVVFTDDVNQFWDGLYVGAGDLRRDLRLAYRHDFGERFVIDVATTAGLATGQNQPDEREKRYVTGDVQSTFTPTRTTLAVSYRELQQPSERGEEDYRTERLHVRMAQSLYLPVDLKLLVGLELARSNNSPYLIDSLGADGGSKKYIGGLALNF